MIFVFVVQSCTAQSDCDPINVGVFTHYQINQKEMNAGDSSFIFNIYDSPNGNVIFDLPSDEESGWSLTIIDKSSNYFKVRNIWRQSDQTLNYWEEDWMPEWEYVWIKSGTVGTNTRNHDGQTVYLYGKPENTSTVVGSFTDVQTVAIWDVCSNWALVEAKDAKGNNIKGWLSPLDQCSSPLTTCN